jgi:excisionase family DNA binding protein
MDEKLNSIEETARRTGLRPGTIRKLAAMRRIAKVKLGRRVLISESEITRLITENTIPRLPERAR